MLSGVCPDCGGTVDLELEICDSHDTSETVCDDCGRPSMSWSRWTCTVCKAIDGGPSWIPLLSHPAVVRFLYEHDIVYHDDPWQMKDLGIRLNFSETLVSREPVRIRFTVSPNGSAGDQLDSDSENDAAEVLHVTLDDTLAVTDLERTI